VAALALALLSFACASPEGERVAALTERDTMQCPSETVEGVDVYDGDGPIDWVKVRGGTLADAGTATPRVFAFIKATQGDYDTQSTFAGNWSNAKSAGLLRGAYHYFDATIDGVAQANFFLAQLGTDIGELPPMLDVECPTSTIETAPGNLCLGNGASGWVDTATLETRVFDWLATVAAATGKQPIIYSYPTWFADLGVTDARLASYPLFIGSAGSCIDVPAPWTHAAFWQYRTMCAAPDTHIPCDLDRWTGDLASLTTFVSGDAGARDASAGTGAGDASVLDASVLDASSKDASSGGASDAAPTDGSSLTDAASAVSPATNSGESSGCGCRVARTGTPLGAAWLLTFGFLLAIGRVRRRSSGRRVLRRGRQQAPFLLERQL
jgi:lysozyme